jgi:predicted house-cleaning noncanonical NTP pyrophosphatase (MazG superfamily)
MKLVRDRIPELAAANSQPAAFHQADPAEYARRLHEKLLEEAQEAASASGPAGLLEELGDVLQVLYALASQAGYSPAEIECARARKARTHGSYTRRMPDRLARPLRPRGHLMTQRPVFIAALEDGCPAAPGWAAYWTRLTLPLAGHDLIDAQATLAGWDDPNSPQGSLGDCLHCTAQVARLRTLVDQATQPSRADGAP